ncbi:hypothetical protein [Dactylosporangium sp. CA-139066]|uniref:hypothetical protein n=1 Tax=Dactylosporangium sp. CA-139066 TaxID=3239930 RepID=UPI003D9191B9
MTLVAAQVAWLRYTARASRTLHRPHHDANVAAAAMLLTTLVLRSSHCAELPLRQYLHWAHQQRSNQAGHTATLTSLTQRLDRSHHFGTGSDQHR